MYSKIVDGGATTKLEKHVLNSTAPKRTSAEKRKWSPGISPQEIALKKHAREEQYLQTLDEKDRPVLHVQAKTVYKDLAAPEAYVGLGHTEKVIRSSYDSKPVPEGAESAYLHQEAQPKVVQVANPHPNPLAKDQVSKIKAVEILPKGFLELDPMLLKDDYRFDSAVHEKLFHDEQRRIKVKRMKQYGQRDQEKERNVTIYVLEEQKNQILEYLDSWFAKTNRLMNAAEIEYVAKTLQTEADSLKQIQEAYFAKLKAVKSKLFERELVRNQEVSKVPGEAVPDALKQYFLTSPTDHYNQIEAKVNSGIRGYNPVYLSKYNKRLHSRRLGIGHKFVKGSAGSPVELTSDDHLLDVCQKFQLAVDNADGPKDLENFGGMKAVMVQSTLVGAPTFGDVTDPNWTAKPSKHQPTKMDRDINSILAQIIHVSKPPVEEPEPPKPEVIAEATPEENGPADHGDSMNMDALMNDLNQNPDAYKREANLLLSEIIPQNEALKIGGEEVPIPEENGEEKQPSQDIQSVPDQLLFRSVDPNKTNISALKPSNRTNNPVRVTTVFKNDKGRSVMIQRLKPLLFRNEFIYQTVIDVVDSNNVRTVVVQTRRESGEAVADQLVDLNLAGNFYDSYLLEAVDEREAHIITRNENKVTVASTTVSEDENIGALKIVKVFERNGYCIDGVYNENLPENEIKRTHRLRPVLIGSDFYRQQVEEKTEGKNKKSFAVYTFNNENVEVSQIKADPNLIQISNYSEVESDQIDGEGVRKIVLLTKNDLNEVIAKQTFMSNIDSQLMDQGCNQLIEEVEYEDGQKQITVGYRNSRGLIFSERLVTATGLEDEYFVQLKNDFMSEGQRFVVFVAKSYDGELLVEKMYRPPVQGDITMAYYEDMIRELRNELTQLYVKPSKKFRFQEVVNFSWVHFELRYDESKSQMSCRALDQRDAILLEKFFDCPKGAQMDAKLTDELVTKMETALLAAEEGGIRKRRFKADFHKTHTVLSKIPDNLGGNVPNDSHLNYSYYKNATGADFNLTESQILAKNPLPRFSKIPRSYFRNLQKELAMVDQTIEGYIDEVSKRDITASGRPKKGSVDKKSVPIRAHKVFKPSGKAKIASDVDTNKTAKSAFGSTVRSTNEKSQTKRLAETTPKKNPHDRTDNSQSSIQRTPKKSPRDPKQSSLSGVSDLNLGKDQLQFRNESKARVV